MTVSLKHTTLADGTFSATGATAWDAEHALTLDTNKVLGRATAGAGSAEELSIGGNITVSGGTLDAIPAGSDTQIQFNNSGAFGASADFTYDPVNKWTYLYSDATAPNDYSWVKQSAVSIGAAVEIDTRTTTQPLSRSQLYAGTDATNGPYIQFVAYDQVTFSGDVTLRIPTSGSSYSYTLTLPNSDGSAGQYLKTDGSGVLSWDTPASVGGSNTQVQFNDGGVLAGDAGLTFNKTTKALTLGGATVTTSNPVLNATQTWNAAGVTFTGLRFNVTDTASAAASLLMDLQVGGTSYFSASKAGAFRAASINLPQNVGNTGVKLAIGGGASGLYLASDYSITWSSASGNGANSIFGGSQDLFLTRRAAANLRFGAADAAAPVAQTLSVQSVVAGTTNTAGANLTITGSQGTGTGAGGSIIFQVAPAGSSGTAQNALATALTISTSGAQIVTTIAGNITIPTGANIGNSAGNQLAIGSGNIYPANNALTIGTAAVPFTSLFVTTQVAWSSGGTADTILLRDAANTLAQRNGTNAQALRVYNTFTSSTNFERANIFWDSNVLKIGTEKGSGGGTARALEFQTDGTTRATIQTSGELFLSATLRMPINTAIEWRTGGTLGSRIYSAADGNFTIQNFGSTDFGRLQFGGTTSSFPAIKRSSTDLQVRLADDSGYTTIDAQHRLQGTAPASATATGTAGDVRYDADYIYICTATNTWKRAAIATWP